MRLCFSTICCPNWSIDEIVENATAMGFAGVELSGRHLKAPISPDLSQSDRKYIKSLFADHNLEIPVVTSYAFFIDPDPEVWRKNLEIAKEFISLANDIGAKAVRIFARDKGLKEMPDGMTHDSCVEAVAKAVNQLGEVAKEQSVEIYLEVHDVFVYPKNLADVLRLVTVSNVGVIWDQANSSVMGVSIDDIYPVIKDRIKHVHLKDYPMQSGKYISQPRPLGKGDMPTARMVKILKEASYKGYLSYENEKYYHADDTVVEPPETSLPAFVSFLNGVIQP